VSQGGDADGAADDAGLALQESVRRAYAGSEFFRATLSAAGVGTDGIAGISELTRLPFTTKEQLRAAYPFGWTCVPERAVVRIHASSGTTGRRTLCTYTRRDLEDWTVMFARCLEYAGITDTDRVQLMVGYGLWTAGWGFQAAVERVGAMAIPSGPGNTELQLELIADLGTTALCATSSFALAVGERVAESGTSTDLRVGIFGSERWSEVTRSRIEGLLGLTAFDIYGLTELWGPGAGIECAEHDGIHVWTDHYLVEIVDPVTLAPLPAGEVGELVVTTLRKEATPLLRYRTRDLTSLDLSPCPCGSPYPRISRLRGRSDDMVKARGVMFFPAHVEHVLSTVVGATGEYRVDVDRDGAGEHVRVQVEAPDALGLAAHVAALLRSEIGLRADVEVVAPGALPRSERKTQRVHDHRVH
jgi:phenylacetate-CoA ligase